MGYFAMTTSKEPLDLIETIEANLRLYLETLPPDADYSYLLTTFVKTDLEKLKEVLNESKVKEL